MVMTGSHVPAQSSGPRDPFDAESEGGLAHGDLALLGEGDGGGEGPHHGVLEFGVEPFFLPFELLDVLGPLEVRAGDAPGVGEDVRYDPDAALGEDLVALGRGR